MRFAPSGTRAVIMNDAFNVAALYVSDSTGANRAFLANGYQPDWQSLP
jgi:hypothetical protein